MVKAVLVLVAMVRAAPVLGAFLGLVVAFTARVTVALAAMQMDLDLWAARLVVMLRAQDPLVVLSVDRLVARLAVMPMAQLAVTRAVRDLLVGLLAVMLAHLAAFPALVLSSLLATAPDQVLLAVKSVSMLPCQLAVQASAPALVRLALSEASSQAMLALFLVPSTLSQLSHQPSATPLSRARLLLVLSPLRLPATVLDLTAPSQLPWP